MKRNVWIFPILTLLLLLTACKDKDSAGDPVQQLSDTVYRSAYLDVAMNADARLDELFDARIGGDAVYFLGQRYDPNAGEKFQYPLLRLPLDGGALEALPYVPAGDAAPEGAESVVTPVALFPCPDATLWVQELVNYNYYDLPKHFDPETQNKWEYRTGGGQTQILRRLGQDGGEELRIDISALAERLGVEEVVLSSRASWALAGVQTPLLDFAGDGGGNLWLLMPGKLCVLDGTGAERLALDWEYDGGCLVPLGDGSVGAFYRPDDYRVKDTLRTVDLESGRWGTRFELNNTVEEVWTGFGEWQFLYDGGEGLCGRNGDSETLLTAWTETTVNPDLLCSCAGLPDGRIVLLCLRNGAPEVTVLSEAGRDTLPEVETLTFAVLQPNEVDWDRVNAFNRTHTDVQIVVKDYLVYAEDGSLTTQGRDRLLTELAAGKVPDIMSLGSFGSTYGSLPYRQMAEKGYFEDLLPYIDSDPELSREDLMEPPLKAAMLDGRLYLAFDSVGISTFVGPERIVGDRYSWTLAELMEAFASMPEGSTISEYSYRKRDMLYYLVNPDSYVDWETGQCSFDSDAFRAALELVNTYPLEFDWTDVQGINEELRQRRRSGLQMLSQSTVLSFDEIWVKERPESGFGERIAFVGAPTEDGSVGSSFRPFGRLVMSSTCKNKEAAWAFIRESFLPRFDMSLEAVLATSGDSSVRWDLIFGGFPINRADFQLLKDYQMTLYSAEDLEFFARHGIDYDPPVTEEAYQRIMDFYSHVEKMELGDDALFAIIEEQCAPYFAGDRTLDETVDQIQRRAALYVNENR